MFFHVTWRTAFTHTQCHLNVLPSDPAWLTSEPHLPSSDVGTGSVEPRGTGERAQASCFLFQVAKQKPERRGTFPRELSGLWSPGRDAACSLRAGVFRVSSRAGQSPSPPAKVRRRKKRPAAPRLSGRSRGGRGTDPFGGVASKALNSVQSPQLQSLLRNHHAESSE